MKKRIFICKILVFMMILSLFTACGKNKETFELSASQDDMQSVDEGFNGSIREDIPNKNSEKNDFDDEIKTSNSLKNDINNKIFVHVCGYVKNPDVYELDNGARAIDAIKLAGGFLKDAKKDYINLAAILNDQDKLYIPSKKYMSDGEILSDNGNNMSTGSNKMININTANKDELMRLSGIGSSRADDIINYRQNNGRFKKIEDIMQVSGIKKAMFEKIKDEISVN